MGGIRPYQSHNGALRASAPLAPSQTFEPFDPVRIVSNQLTTAPKDGTAVLDDEFVGFAATGARGILAASRASGAGALEQASPMFFGDVGATENTIREYIRPQIGQLWATNNYWADATGAAQSTIAGSALHALRQIASAAAGQWGLVAVAGVPGTDLTARILYILDKNGQHFNADTAATATTGDRTGPTIVFEIVDLQGLDQVMGG